MAGERRGVDAVAKQHKVSRVRRTFRWIGENFAKALIAALATALVSAGIALVVTEQQSLSSHKIRTKVSRDSARFDSWPDGVNAWTVILASETTKGLAESAVEKAKRIASHGLNIGVFHSNDHISLRPGYWVAFAGQFDSVDEAQQVADRYRGQFPTSYQRFIEEK
jgi:hypothetical protein